MLTDKQRACIAWLVNQQRPDWDRPGIEAVLTKVADRSLVSVTIAAMRATERTTQATPAVIAMPGPHWVEVKRDEPTDTPPPFQRGRSTDAVTPERAAEHIARLREITATRKESA